MYFHLTMSKMKHLENNKIFSCDNLDLRALTPDTVILLFLIMHSLNSIMLNLEVKDQVLKH